MRRTIIDPAFFTMSFFYRSLLRPILFQIDPEKVHNGLLWLADLLQNNAWAGERLRKSFPVPDAPRTVFGLTFRNPVGLAAGYLKNAEAIPFFEALGFGFLEVGSVTARPWPGNVRPRIFRIPGHEALLNRMGLNNIGADAVAARLAKTPRAIPLGVSITKTADPGILRDRAIADIATCFRKMQPVADFIVLNISCPNTSDGKTFEDYRALDELLSEIASVEIALVAKGLKKKPILLKFSPDPEDLAMERLLATAENHHAAGLVIANPSVNETLIPGGADIRRKLGNGGFSGKPLMKISTDLLRRVRTITGGRLPIVGVGGVMNGADARVKFDAGASLVELYTGLIYRGPELIREACEKTRI
jgi:dihydroorotate dehydrogenase